MWKRLILGVVIGLSAGTGTSQAFSPWRYTMDAYYQRLARDWVRLYLRRNPTPREVLLITNQLRNGASADAVQANIIASNEYFRRAGGLNATFIRSLMFDVLGRGPTLLEQSRLMTTIQISGRYQAALDVLISRSTWWW
jgi:hypothetical protein